MEKSVVSEVIPINNNQSAPILLHFQNGQLYDRECQSTKMKVLNNEKKEKVVLFSNNENIYKGHIGCGLSKNLVNTFIAVRNKITNKVRLVQIEQAEMRNIICDSTYSDDDTENAEKPIINDVIKAFGGSRANRALERREKMKVNINVVKDQLEKTLNESGSIELCEEDSVPNHDNLHDICPPYNNMCSRIEDIYTVSDIISQNLLDNMDDEAHAVLNSEIEKLPINSNFILEKIKNIKKSSDPYDNENLKTVKILIFMDALINLIKTRRRNFNNFTFSEVTPKVHNEICLKFFEKSSSLLKTSITAHKSACYFIVLAIIISNNFEIDINILSKEMCLARKTIIKYSSYIHAKIISKTDILRLHLPKNIAAPKPRLFIKRK